MSEVQTGITSVTREISTEDLRRAEEERRAAELADRMRREEEARQRALAGARNTTARAHELLSNLQQQLNEAKRRLPDLSFSFDSLPEMPKGGDISKWERHAATVSSLVHSWRSDLDLEIGKAEIVLRRRLRTQKAWEEYRYLQSLHKANMDQLLSLWQILPEVRQKVDGTLENMSDSSSYEEIEAYNQQILLTIEGLREEIRRFTSIGLNNNLLATQIQRMAQPFEMVMGDERLKEWNVAIREEAQYAFETELLSQLTKTCWSEGDLPIDLLLCLARIRSGIATPENTDFYGRLLLATEKRAWMEAAQNMLNSAPSYIPHDLVDEWRFILAELDKVAFGNNPLTTNLIRRYQRIHETSKLALTHAYVFAQAKAAIAECGLIIEEDVIDLVFDGNENPSSVMAMTVPGFHDRKVILSMDALGNTASLPLRFNDSDSEFENVRDIEFDQEICHRLGRALSSLASSGIEIDMAKEKTDHPVLRASDLGIKLRRRDDPARENKLYVREA